LLGHKLNPYDVIIVGGGIVGAACANELKSKGLNVLVLDADYMNKQDQKPSKSR